MIDSRHSAQHPLSEQPTAMDEILAEAMALAERVNRRLGVKPSAAQAQPPASVDESGGVPAVGPFES
jgi:hypothetical protein